MSYPPASLSYGNGGLNDMKGYGGMDTGQQAMLGQGLGSVLGGLFGDNQNPADAAMPYLGQIEGKMKPYYQPYISAGQSALPELQKQYQSLMSNPGALMQQIGQGYQASPGYGWQQNEAMQAGNNAAAAGGMLGSPAHQQNAQATASGLANQDYYNYLNHALNQYQTGLQGMGGINQMGYGASSEMASNLAKALQSQATAAYGGAAGQNASDAGMFGGLGSLAGMAMGGPLGGMAGSFLGNLFG